jgi:ribosome-associated protein
MSTADDVLVELARLGVPEEALQFRAIRSSGPGGQHVNKVSTALQLSCDLQACQLSAPVRARLKTIAGHKLRAAGILSLTAQSLRTQEQNRRDALERLLAMIAEAHIAPKLRFATKPTRASKVRRLESKQQRSQHKQLRRKVRSLDD